MSATVAGEACRKKAVGFTIDSIIGKQQERCENGRTLSGVSTTDHSKDKLQLTSEEKRSSGFREKHEGAFCARQRHEEDVRSSGESDFGRDTSVHSFHLTDKHLHHPNMDSLKHLHDVLAQTAGATGTYFHPRMCRHPLSPLNLHSVYPHSSQGGPLHPLVINPASRDVRTLQPWMSDRYSNYFYPRYPVSASPGFLFQPYRKPKRIRTAFSPAQLLQLEKSFEKSHYVVGQERKDLAGELQLTETQVKVWFQNRRTKHKRTKAEEGDGKECGDFGGSGNRCSSPEISSDISDDMDLDVSDDEMRMMPGRHHLEAAFS